MAPPELARDAPVVDVAHPFVVGLAILLRCEANVAFVDRGDGLFGERLNLDEPLGGEARLDHGLAAIALADGVGVIFHGIAGLVFELGDDSLARLIAIEPGEWTGHFVEVRGFIHDVDGLEFVALADGVVVGIVRRRDFDRAGAELRADPRVGDDGDFAPNERHAHACALQMAVALVDGMDGDGDVAEHGLRPRSGDEQRFVRADDAVGDGVQLAHLLFMNHFEVGDGGLAVRAPVDDVSAAIDQPLFM